MTKQSLPHAILVYNIDGTPNEAGSIKEEVDLICAYGNHTEHTTFSITSLGHLAIILGHTWLTEQNPEVNWHSGEVRMVSNQLARSLQLRQSQTLKKTLLTLLT